MPSKHFTDAQIREMRLFIQCELAKILQTGLLAQGAPAAFYDPDESRWRTTSELFRSRPHPPASDDRTPDTPPEQTT